MQVHFRCQCGRLLTMDEAYAGKTVRCPACRQTVEVPGGALIQRSAPAPAARSAARLRLPKAILVAVPVLVAVLVVAIWHPWGSSGTRGGAANRKWTPRSRPARPRLPPEQNAATYYRQAFQAMPKGKRSQAEIEVYEKSPLDAVALGLLNRYETALTLMLRGAALKQCNWELKYEEGLELLLPHLAPVRTLGRMACLEARLLFQQGQDEEAFQTLTAVMVMARHLGSDPILVCLLFQVVVESCAAETAAANLVGRGAPALRGFSSRLDGLPDSATLPETMFMERVMCLDYLRKRSSEGRGEQALRFMFFLPPVFKVGDRQAEQRALCDAVRKYGGLEKCCDETEPFYDELARMAALPFRDSLAAEEAFRKKAEAANPLAKVLLPGLLRSLYPAAKIEAQRAMLRAAIDIVSQGQQALARHRDPFGDGPFEYRPLPEGGFELKSKVPTLDNKPVTLTVGKPPGRTP